MPSVGDTFRIKIITEMQGVSMTNLLYYEIDDLGTDASPREQLVSFGDQFLAAVGDNLADTWALTCLIYKNIFAAESQTLVFTNLLGTGIGNPHPAHVVARFNQYANDTPETDGKHGAFNLSGAVVSKSNKGRIASKADWVNFEVFLKSSLTLDTDGWEVTPQLRWLLAEGPPIVHAFDPLIKVRLSKRFNILQSRRSKLCQVG